MIFLYANTNDIYGLIIWDVSGTLNYITKSSRFDSFFTLTKDSTSSTLTNGTITINVLDNITSGIRYYFV